MAPDNITDIAESRELARADLRKGGWVKHTTLNTLEQAVTRGSDAGTSLLLLWFLSPEWFSKLAVAQALVAPCLFFFIAPETVIYRDYSIWRAEGPSVIAGRISAIRKFGYLKAIVALVLAFGLALLNHEVGSKGTSFDVRFFALLWAFAWVLAPQICGADREFLRLDLQLERLNFLSLYQKLSMLLGTLAMLLFFQGSDKVFAGLAVVAAFSALSTAWIARASVKNWERRSGAGAHDIRFCSTIIEAIASFSLWQHFIGVIQGWIQTMDVFFLGVLKFAARGVGLYAAVLKIANISMALPIALANAFTIWLGRELETRDRSIELRKLWGFSGWITLYLVLQAGILYLITPWILSVLSRGRWLPVERSQMMGWFGCILLGSTLFGLSFLFSGWFALRAVQDTLFRLYLPWLALSLAIYFTAIHYRGIPGAAIANIPVALVYLALAGLLYRKVARAS